MVPLQRSHSVAPTSLRVIFFLPPHHERSENMAFRLDSTCSRYFEEVCDCSGCTVPGSNENRKKKLIQLYGLGAYFEECWVAVKTCTSMVMTCAFFSKRSGRVGSGTPISLQGRRELAGASRERNSGLFLLPNRQWKILRRSTSPLKELDSSSSTRDRRKFECRSWQCT